MSERMREETVEGVCKHEDGPPISGSKVTAQFVSLVCVHNWTILHSGAGLGDADQHHPCFHQVTVALLPQWGK